MRQLNNANFRSCFKPENARKPSLSSYTQPRNSSQEILRLQQQLEKTKAEWERQNPFLDFAACRLKENDPLKPLARDTLLDYFSKRDEKLKPLTQQIEYLIKEREQAIQIAPMLNLLGKSISVESANSPTGISKAQVIQVRQLGERYILKFANQEEIILPDQKERIICIHL